MVQSLEQYVAEATNAYKPAQTAVQNQLNALAGQLETANQQINKNYAQQQSGLNRQRNMAAESASMQAAGSGGSFGGATNLANRKYYDQSFVPAQTQLNTNQSNELAQTRQNFDNQRTNLNSQLSNLEAQANQLALQKYWADVEAEKQRQWEAEQAELARQAQLKAARAASGGGGGDYGVAQMLMDAMKNGGQQQTVNRQNVGFLDWINQYSGWDNKTKQFWTKNITGIQNQKGMTGNLLRNYLDSLLKKNPVYKQYLKWQKG